MRRAVVVLLLLTAACSPGQVGGGPSPSSPSPRVSTSPAAHAALSSGGVVERSIPTPPSSPTGCAPRCRIDADSLVLGPDGNMWFDSYDYGVIGRMTLSGGVRAFALPVDVVGGANRLAAGSDGNLWLTATGGGQGQPDWILRVTTSGEVTKLKAGEIVGGNSIDTGPESITEGPDGNMWFTEFWANRIGRMSPLGILSEYPIPTARSAPRGIVTGVDGNVWFVEATRDRPAIARITPEGVITEFRLTTEATDNTPYHIVNGPDGDLWFDEPNTIGHISTAGKITWMSLPEGTRPTAMVTGPDGNVWFADQHTDSLFRIGVTGATRSFRLPRRGMGVLAMAVGADGRIWFSEGGHSSIGSIGVKVPEILMSHRPLVFDGAAGKSVDIRNTGDAPLTISRDRITGVDAGLFSIASDSCAGTTFAPDGTCRIELRHAAGGPAGIQAALLEISSDAGGSPQRLQLVAQPPQCSLPVIGSAGDGEQLVVPLAEVHYDASGNLGDKAGYFDRAYGKWLPVDASAVSPDGSRYAYLPPVEGQRSEVRVVDVATRTEKSLRVPAGFWGIFAFTRDGIYLQFAYEGVGQGAMLLNPDTGAVKSVLTDAIVGSVDDSTAWLMSWNPADNLPNPAAMGGAGNQVLKRDLATGKTTTWLYRPGTDVWVVGVVNGSPVVSAYDGLTTTYWIVTAPDKAQKLEFAFESSVEPSENGFVADSTGLWIGSADGVYVWTARTGAVLVTEQAERPAGTCA